MERKQLLLLNPVEYEHQFDKKALKTLEGTPGLEKAVKYIAQTWCRKSYAFS